MRKLLWLAVVGLFCYPGMSAQASGWRKDSSELVVLNVGLRGKVIDHTANHGHDKRIWSRTLGQRRDLYVYLPPWFDPHLRYPVILFLHGFGQDEHAFLDFVRWLDQAIAARELPPCIAAGPDGSIRGEPGHAHEETFFLNSNLGDYEDFLIGDVWDFVASHYPIRSEREAHVLFGVSMGGFAAFNLGIRYRDAFGEVVGVNPPLNVRWVSDTGNPQAKFDPYHWGWRSNYEKGQHFFPEVHLVSHVTHHPALNFYPLFGYGVTALNQISCNNPTEMVDRTCLRNGQLQMYVAYGAKDEYNIDAQVESFLYLAKCRGICVGVGFDPDGKHDMRTAYRLFPGIVNWLGPRLGPYDPYAACRIPYVCQKPAEPRPEVKHSVKREPVAERIPVPPSSRERIPERDSIQKDPPPLPQRKDLGPYAGPPVSLGPYDDGTVESLPASRFPGPVNTNNPATPIQEKK